VLLQMVAYGEFRRAFQKDEHDERIVCYGMRYLIETYVAQPWTERDVEWADKFFATHNTGFHILPFPKDIFRKARTSSSVLVCPFFVVSRSSTSFLAFLLFFFIVYQGEQRILPCED